ncbi:MAG: vWA domain-containing protein [Planifilum sp.]|jgi:uncharacterized protein with von Willebrand factor type A (vWA) domain
MVSSSPMKPDLVEHLLRFCRALRSHGFSIGPGEEIDMFRALEAIDIGDREEFTSALRLVLCSDRDEQALFDTLFERFLLAAESDAGGRPIQLIPETREVPEGGAASRKGGKADAAPPDGKSGVAASPPPRRDGVEAVSPGGAGPGLEDGGEKWDVPLARVARLSAAHLSRRSTAEIPDDGMEEMLEAAALLVSRVPIRRSRRRKPMRRGTRLHFRRVFRQSVSSGGDMVLPAWSGDRRRQARFLLFCDGSRSMAPFSGCFLQFAYALTRKARRAEVFLFSTRIRRVTDQLCRDGKGRLPTLTGLGLEWGGGTRIGESLEHFLKGEGRWMLGRDSLVIIASDGLDSGEADRLSRSMAELRRRSAGVIWLNPLLSHRNYRPEAEGMKAALPYIDIFSAACDPPSFRKLAKRISSRR